LLLVGAPTDGDSGRYLFALPLIRFGQIHWKDVYASPSNVLRQISPNQSTAWLALAM